MGESIKQGARMQGHTHVLDGRQVLRIESLLCFISHGSRNNVHTI